MRFLPIALLLFAFPAFGQGAADTSTTQAQRAPAVPRTAKPPSPTGSVHGIVTLTDTRGPARGAMVMVVSVPKANGRGESGPGGQGFARTSLDGSYTVRDLPEGEYGVLVILPGYLTPLSLLSYDSGDSREEMMNAILSSGAVSVRGHQTATHDIALERGASVSGRVLYSDGTPATQVNIDVQDTNEKAHAPKPGEPDINMGALMSQMFTHQSSSTDDQGHFRISGLHPGKYRVAAVQASNPDDTPGESGMLGMLSINNPTDLRVFSGDTIHKSAAKTYDLRVGDDVTGIDITVSLTAFHKVHGLITAKDGRGVNIAQLTLKDNADDSLIYHATPVQDGSFEFVMVPSGTYTLTSTGAKIMELIPNTNGDIPFRYAPKRTAAMFADNNTAVIVQDSDIDSARLVLTDIPMPPDADNKVITNPIGIPSQD